jgi:hypothetical protein
VRRERACLDQLPMTTSELLGLRAGLSGPAMSRSEAASQLGISRRHAALLERRGLRALRAACGGAGGGRGSSGGAAPARLVSLTTSAPALQPAIYLPASGAPELRPAGDLEHQRGSGAVKGVTASSPPPSPSPSDTGLVPAAATSAGLGEDAAGGSALPIVLAACLAAFAALMLVGLRRRAVANQRGAAVSAGAPSRYRGASPAARSRSAAPIATAGTAPAAGSAAQSASARGAVSAPTSGSAAQSASARGAAPAPTPPAAVPALEADERGRADAPATGWAGPSADRGADASPTGRPSAETGHPRVTRSASVVASGLVSFAVRELVRRRRKGR